MQCALNGVCYSSTSNFESHELNQKQVKILFAISSRRYARNCFGYGSISILQWYRQ